MAYNVVKGIVEGSVDQENDQEIRGVKIFKSTISASVFYDTDARSPCATENKVALTKLSNSTLNGVLTYQGDKIARSNYNLTFDGNMLSTPHLHAAKITGSGGGLWDVPADALRGTVPANSIRYTDGLYDYRSSLKVKNGFGIMVNDDGVSVHLHTNSGLGIRSRKLSLDLKNTLKINEKGQNISDSDLIVVHDTMRDEVRHSTFKNLYDGYLVHKVLRPQGPQNSIQINNGKNLAGSPALTFDPRAGKLQLQGELRASSAIVSQDLEVCGDLKCTGAVFGDIKCIKDARYNFGIKDNTILFDASDNKIVATLPPAKENSGRIITVKRICSDQSRYKIAANHILTINTEGELIDFFNEIQIKSNYSIRAFQSDGNKWWIINKSGS